MKLIDIYLFYRYHNHKIIGWVWIFLAIPSMIWWKDSVQWVILMSIYANAEASFSADQAKKARHERQDGA